MHTVHETTIHAPPAAVFGIGVDIERWPALDPAYRWCRILERDDTRTVFEMAGNIRGWPGRWTAVQERFPGDRRIVFTHLRGITTGMRVAWDIRDAGQAGVLRITHELALQWPLIGPVVSDRIIGPIFIDWIARRPLRGAPWNGRISWRPNASAGWTGSPSSRWRRGGRPPRTRACGWKTRTGT